MSAFYEVVAHELSGGETAAICARLAQAHLPVLAAMDEAHVLQLWPERAMTTAEEVTVLHAFIDATDGRIAWHKKGPR